MLSQDDQICVVHSHDTGRMDDNAWKEMPADVHVDLEHMSRV